MTITKEKINQKYLKKFGKKNIFSLPSLKKVVLNLGLSDLRLERKKVEQVEEILKKISGQKPIRTKAKKAISAFKIKKGQIVALKVTLRGKRMYQFLEKFICLVLPRIRDFDGISESSFDQQGNLTIGLKDSSAFFELSHEEAQLAPGLEVTIVSSAKDKTEAKKLLTVLGMVFKK